MELENIVANTVYLKAREGELTAVRDISSPPQNFGEEPFRTLFPNRIAFFLSVTPLLLFLSKVALTVTKAKAKSGVKYYNSHTYPNV